VYVEESKMNELVWIIGSTFMISLIAFFGALTLFLKDKILNKILLVLVAFSAGALIGGAFLHLMPEAIIEVGVDEVSIINIFLYFLLGFCVFFVLEQIIRWHHHQFTVSYHLGIITFFTIALHEIPQEIGDFGVLVYGGFRKTKALILNYISAITVIFGGVTGYLIHTWIGESTVFLLPFAAGNFIYIASADLIPEIRYKENLKKSSIRFAIFLTGILLMMAVKVFHYSS